MERRLVLSGWLRAITTSTHLMFTKRDWLCAIHRATGEVKFTREAKIGYLIRGLIEKGIE